MVSSTKRNMICIGCSFGVYFIAIFPVRFLKWLKKGLDWTSAPQIFSSSHCFSIGNNFEEAAVFGSCCSNEERTVQGLPPALVKAMTESNWVSSRCLCIGCTWGGSRMVMIWYFDNKSPLSVNIFCHISQMDNCWASMMFFFIFLWLQVFELLGTFLQNHI